MLKEYIESAIKTAKYEILEEDGSVYGEIPLCKVMYAKTGSFEECREELIEVLVEWLFIRLRRNLEIPVINNIDLNKITASDAPV